MTTIVIGVLIVIGSAALAVVGFLVLLRLAPHISSEKNNELLAVVFAVVSGLYGLVLAFVVVNSWQGYADARGTTDSEVVSLSNIVRNGDALPRSFQTELDSRILKYSRLVVSEEWDELAHGTFAPSARHAYERIWALFYTFEPKTESEKEFYSEGVARLNELGASRRERIYASQSTVPGLLWGLIIIGGLLTVGLLYLFWSGHRSVQAAIIGLVGAFIGFIVFLIFALQHPFAGELAVPTQPFDYFIDQLQSRGTAAN